MLKMYSIEGLIPKVPQPNRGYLPISEFKQIKFTDGKYLEKHENLSPLLMSMTIDRLVSYMITKDIDEVFSVSLKGARIANDNGLDGALYDAYNLCDSIRGLDIESINSACKLVTFNVWVKSFRNASKTVSYKDININSATNFNIKVMVERTLRFFEKYGPVIANDYGFGKGYTKLVNYGLGDYLTVKSIVDLKILKSNPNKRHTLRVLLHYVMGKHSEKEIFKNIENICIFNPRLNILYIKPVNELEDDLIEIIEEDILCYHDDIFI